MTKIKLCGLKRTCDIEWANALNPDYVGFIFAKNSRRCVTPGEAGKLKAILHPAIKAVGVFVDEAPEVIAELAVSGTIDLLQLHGSEDETYLECLRRMVNVPVIQAFRITSGDEVRRAQESSADMVLLDAGAGCGEVFDWSLLQDIRRPYFLAGGLTSQNVADALECLHPYGVDVSSSLETDGYKDQEKMAAFVEAVRGRETDHGR